MEGNQTTVTPASVTETYYVTMCINNSNATNCTNCSTDANLMNGAPKAIPIVDILMVTSYAIICSFGLLGNGMVIYVVLIFSKMKTVTNMYILNLAISDVLFLLSLPFLMTTTLLQYWLFGRAMCKIFFVLVSINLFTGVFTLTAMSADRYMAVCHPVRSVNYRTPRIAFFVCLSIWTISFFVMLPIILYSTTVQNPKFPDHETCAILWPSGQPIPGDKAFTWYTFLLGFSVPVALISVFYISVVCRLRRIGPSKKSKERKKSNRKVTKMVLAMISVYVCCWLPYWVFQVDLTFKPRRIQVEQWQIYLFNAFTVLSFANSMLNPLLYAFLSEVFRKSFIKAFKCAKYVDFNKSTCVDNSICPRSVLKGGAGGSRGFKKAEFTAVATNHTDATCLNHTTAAEVAVFDNTTVYVDKESQTKRDEEEIVL